LGLTDDLNYAVLFSELKFYLRFSLKECAFWLGFKLLLFGTTIPWKCVNSMWPLRINLELCSACHTKKVIHFNVNRVKLDMSFSVGTEKIITYELYFFMQIYSLGNYTWRRVSSKHTLQQRLNRPRYRDFKPLHAGGFYYIQRSFTVTL